MSGLEKGRVRKGEGHSGKGMNHDDDDEHSLTIPFTSLVWKALQGKRHTQGVGVLLRYCLVSLSQY